MATSVATSVVTPSANLPLLIDAFPYNGEEVVAFRLALLDAHVDHFIITEARETFTGLKKPALYFEQHAEVFAPYRHKISFLAIDSFPPVDAAWKAAHPTPQGNEHVWWNEAVQRNRCQAEAFRLAAGAPFVLISADVDEIPDPRLLADKAALHAASNGPLFLDMAFHYYNFNWRKPERWQRAFFIRDSALAEVNLDDVRRHPAGGRVVLNAGWHLSYFTSVEAIARKIESFSHSEFNLPQFKQAAHIQRCMKEGIDLFGRQHEELVPTPADAALPPGWAALQAQLERLQGNTMAIDSDKQYWHRYTPAYDALFAKMAAPKLIIEFGVFHGGSIRWMLERFPAAQIIGVDILPVQPDWPLSQRVRYVQLDQGNPEAIAALLQPLAGQIDLILEDGSHDPLHQLSCLLQGMAALKAGGTYILEDIHTSLPEHPAFRARVPGSGRAAASLHLLLAAEHQIVTAQPLARAALQGLADAVKAPLADVLPVFERASSVDVVRRGLLPLQCWRCRTGAFDFVRLQCLCGEALYAPTDSMTAIVRLK